MKMCEYTLKKHSRKNSGNDEVEIHLNAIQLLIKQNLPPLICDYLETKP